MAELMRGTTSATTSLLGIANRTLPPLLSTCAIGSKATSVFPAPHTAKTRHSLCPGFCRKSITSRDACFCTGVSSKGRLTVKARLSSGFVAGRPSSVVASLPEVPARDVHWNISARDVLGDILACSVNSFDRPCVSRVWDSHGKPGSSG